MYALDNIQIAIHDRQMVTVDHLNNSVPKAVHYYDEKLELFLDSGSARFTFTVDKFQNGVLDERVSYINDMSYVSFRFMDEDYLFNIITLEDTGFALVVECETTNLSLLNEHSAKYENESGSYTFVEYFEIMGIEKESKLEIGINEISEEKRILSYDNEETVLARVLSLVSDFNAECKFRTVLYPNGQLDKLVIDVYKARTEQNLDQGVGSHRKDVRLYFSKYEDGITKKVDKSNLFNAIKVRNKDGEYLKMTKEQTIKDADGRNVITGPRRSNTIYAPLSMERYPSLAKVNVCDNWITRIFDTELTTAEEFWAYGSAMLKKYMYPIVEYTIPYSIDRKIQDLSLRIGDSIYFQDPKYFDTMIIMGRITKMEISFTKPEKNELTLSNFVEIRNGLSSSIQNEMKTLARESAPLILEYTTTSGMSFINGNGETAITPQLSQANTNIYEGVQYTYYRDGVYWTEGSSVEVTPDMLTENKMVLTIEAIYRQDKRVSIELTFTNTVDGADGVGVSTVETYYKLSNDKEGILSTDTGWAASPLNTSETNKYLWTYRKEVMTDGSSRVVEPYIVATYAEGKDGNGIKKETTYYLAIDKETGVTHQTSGWTTAVQTMTIDKRFLWTYTRTEYTNGTDNTSNPILMGSYGLPGVTKNIHIAYANDPSGLDFSLTNGDRKYMGTYISEEATAPTDYTKYTWVRIQGRDGEQGIPGAAGQDGKTSYIHFAYASSADGREGFSTTDTGSKRYRGHYTDFKPQDSTNPNDYTWIDMLGSVSVGGKNYINDWSFKDKSKWFYETNKDRPVGVSAQAGDELDITTRIGLNWARVYTTSQVGPTLAQITPGVYTMSFWARSVLSTGEVQGYLEAVYKDASKKKVINTIADIKDKRSKIVSTGEITEADLTNNGSPLAYWRFVVGTPENGMPDGDIMIRRPMLEAGNIATDGMPSIDDLYAMMDDGIGREELAEEIRRSEERAAVKAIDEISDRWAESYASLIDANAQRTEDAHTAIAEAEARIVAVSNELGDAVTRWSATTSFMDYSDSGLRLGKGVDTNILISPDGRISMYADGKEMMYMTSDALYIQNGIFSKRIQIGRFVTMGYYDDPDIVVIRYVGGQ